MQFLASHISANNQPLPSKIRLLHTSILDIYTVIELLVCCLKAILLHPHTVTLAKFAPDQGTQGHLWSEKDFITSWLRLISTSNHFIHTYLTYKKWLSHCYAVSREYGFIFIPWHRPNWRRIWELRVTCGVKWCHNVMVEADIHLRPLCTSILDINKVFESLLCCLKGIWLHPYTITPAKLAPDLGPQGHLRSNNDTITSWSRLITTSDCFLHPY